MSFWNLTIALIFQYHPKNKNRRHQNQPEHFHPLIHQLHLCFHHFHYHQLHPHFHPHFHLRFHPRFHSHYFHSHCLLLPLHHRHHRHHLHHLHFHHWYHFLCFDSPSHYTCCNHTFYFYFCYHQSCRSFFRLLCLFCCFEICSKSVTFSTDPLVLVI